MNQQLPIELECFLLKYGFFELDSIHTESKVIQMKPTGWTPSYENEEPPF